MTISIYSGTPGSGKSYHATARIRDALYRRHPVPVVCNYDLRTDLRNREFFHFKPNVGLHPDWLVGFATDWWKSHRFRENGILLVIDECQLLFNSREWSNPDRMAWLEFFSQHRHYGYEVVFVAQSDRMVDRQFRALLEYDVQHRKLSNYGLFGALLSLVAFGRVFAAVTYYYGLKDRIAVKFFVSRKRVYTLYDSYGSTFEHV